MPCPEGGSSEPLLTNVPVLDWSRVHVYTPAGIHFPSTRQDVVAIVQKVEKSGSKAKAVGSVYSLSNAPDSDDFVIDTKRLNRHLSQPFPPLTPLAATRWVVGEGLPESESTFRSTDHNKAWLADFAGDDVPRQRRFLVHVEAGIKIRQLLADLDSAGLAVPTMGAGGGQSLAGALSTSTHGADLDLGTLGDAVRAVHLVGVDGQEWWIERNGGAGRFVEYSDLPGWCADTRVVRDSDFLESVIVGVGRFGIIYSMVLEVMKQYRLEELRHETTWKKVRSHLITAVTSGYTSAAGGLFEEPAPCQQIADALAELKQGTYEIFDPDLKEYIELPSTPEMIEAKQKELDACLEENGREKGPGPRATQIVLDSASRSLVWISQRRAIVNDKPDEFGDAFNVFGYLCAQDFETATLVKTAASVAATTLHNLGVGAAAGGSPGTAKEFFELAAGLLAAAASFKTLGEFVGKVLDLLKEFDDLGIGVIERLLKEISAAALAGEHDPYLRRGRSGKIMDLHNYKYDGCLSVNSAEFFFDAASTAYITFIDELRDVAKSLGPMVGVMALRFMRKTPAKLGMQRWARTVSIEVAVPRPGKANAAYMAAAQALAFKFGGIPHWGQEHSIDAARVAEIYGADLETWRWALAETDAAKRNTFSSRFTRERGLEAPEEIDVYRGRRYVAAIVSGMY